MLGSLRARLVVSFALVVAMAVFLAGAGALFLLRDKQQQSALERYGRLAEPLNEHVARLQSGGESLENVRAYLATRAEETDVRILLLDQDQIVVYDSENSLFGHYVLSFESSKVTSSQSGGVRYQWVNYDRGSEHLTMFAAPSTDEGAAFAAPLYEAVIAIPQDKVASAWLDLVPRLALAGGIALAVSFIVSYFISRSISGPLARITQASRQMAAGNYDVHIPISGQDEVGRLCEAFNQMAQEISSSQRLMKDLLANVSHELKTPLTSIQGYSQAVLDGLITDAADLKDSSRTINDEANRMRALVDDLLLLSQLESGQVAMEHAHVDVHALLERAVERFHWAVRDAGIETKLSVEAIPEVHGDERRLEQVFSNLLQNAVRHTPRGGTITVSAKTLPGGHVSIGVHNTGSVIPRDDLPRVFERFFQVDRARARKGSGTSGLGLSIVAEIIEAHGGTVRAISSEAGGTEFLVILPNPKTTDVRNGRIVEDTKPKRPTRPQVAVSD